MTAPLDLDALLAKALAATPGPWEVQTDKHPHFRGGAHTEHRIRTAWIHGQLKDHYPVVTTSVGIPEFENGRPCRMVSISKEDAKHIAAACPATMLELLARLATAEAEAAHYRGVANEVRKQQLCADDNAILRQQAEALHLVAHALGLPAGEDVTNAVLPAVKRLVAPAQPHGHRDDYYLLANCRRLLAHTAWVQKENWDIAMELFATGSTSAKEICVQAGIDPYSKKVERAK